MGLVTYSAEPIPTAVMKGLFEAVWDSRINDEIPQPSFIEVTNEEQRMALMEEGQNYSGDFVVFRFSPIGMNEKLQDAWGYKQTETQVTAEIHTVHSRQRLYDLFQELRRITHNYVHESDTTGYQVLIFETFLEKSDIQQNLFEAEMRFRMYSSGVVLDT